MLRDAGFAVQTVASGDAAVAACALRLPDIALLDVEMRRRQRLSGVHQYSRVAGRRGSAHRHGDRMRRYRVDRSSLRRRRHGLRGEARQLGAAGAPHPLCAARRAHHSRLRFSEQKNTALLKAIPDGIFLVDGQGRDRALLQPRCRARAILPNSRAANRCTSAISFRRPRARAPGLPRCHAAWRSRGVRILRSTPNRRASRHFECRYLPNSAVRCWPSCGTSRRARRPKRASIAWRTSTA